MEKKDVDITWITLQFMCYWFTFPGDMLPVDGIVIHSNDLKVDESALTGETDLVRKGENYELILFSGWCLIKSTYCNSAILF